MEYVDRWMRCADCNSDFIWTAHEQAFYTQRELKPPKRCVPCRKAKRAEWQQRESGNAQ